MLSSGNRTKTATDAKVMDAALGVARRLTSSRRGEMPLQGWTLRDQLLVQRADNTGRCRDLDGLSKQAPGASRT